MLQNQWPPSFLWHKIPLKWRQLLLVSFSIGVGWAIYGASDWVWWRKAIIYTMQIVTDWLSIPLVVHGFELSLGGYNTVINRDCTYGQWVATAVPMLWTLGVSSRLMFVLGMVALCQLVNIARILVATLATANGIPWFWAHDIPDYVIWYGSIALLALIWLHRHFPAERARK